MSAPAVIAHDDIQGWVRAAVESVTKALDDAFYARGAATMAVSGGSTPGPVYDKLCLADIEWYRVKVGLADERWIPLRDPASNERQVRERLLRHRAAAARFVAMKTPAPTPFDAEPAVDARYREALAPLDVVILGMGADGHTASLFPGSLGLASALDPGGWRMVAAIDASECPVAGGHLLRMSLTLPALSQANRAVLLLRGEEKRRVFEAAMTQDRSDAPVRAVADALGARLVVHWAP
ncbi:MAG: 6-phosphogluconolactonase [Maricaulaceae bacterium]